MNRRCVGVFLSAAVFPPVCLPPAQVSRGRTPGVGGGVHPRSPEVWYSAPTSRPLEEALWSPSWAKLKAPGRAPATLAPAPATPSVSHPEEKRGSSGEKVTSRCTWLCGQEEGGGGVARRTEAEPGAGGTVHPRRGGPIGNSQGGAPGPRLRGSGVGQGRRLRISVTETTAAVTPAFLAIRTRGNEPPS